MNSLADVIEFPVEEGERAYVVKPLDSTFATFGEALYAWLHSTGYEEGDKKIPDGMMVRAFCNANQIPHAAFDIDDSISSAQFFESDQWFFDFLEKHDFFRLGQGKFFKRNALGQPICFISALRHHGQNIDATINGDEELVKEFYALVRDNLTVDTTLEKKSPYAEVVVEHGFGGPKMTLKKGYIENVRIAQPEYYPYLEGGVKALIKEFMESDETVLILRGKPGTGKSSAVAAAVDELNLLPIYAKKTEVVLEKGFVQYICQASDVLMQKVEGSTAKKRSDMFTQSKLYDQEFPAGEELGAEVNAHEEARVPIMVVEDGDELIAPRNKAGGNVRMAELLNETDGIGSNHSRKIIITTNVEGNDLIDEALIRPGRCFDVVHCRNLTPEEAVKARKAAGLPEFTEVPKHDVSLAVALRKPRQKIALHEGKASIGFLPK